MQVVKGRRTAYGLLLASWSPPAMPRTVVFTSLARFTGPIVSMIGGIDPGPDHIAPRHSALLHRSSLSMLEVNSRL